MKKKIERLSLEFNKERVNNIIYIQYRRISIKERITKCLFNFNLRAFNKLPILATCI